MLKIYSNDQNSASKKVVLQPKKTLFSRNYDVNYMYIEYKVCILLRVRLPMYSGVGNMGSYHNLNILSIKYFF